MTGNVDVVLNVIGDQLFISRLVVVVLGLGVAMLDVVHVPVDFFIEVEQSFLDGRSDDALLVFNFGNFSIVG